MLIKPLLQSQNIRENMANCVASQKFLHHFFKLSQETKDLILNMAPNFGFGNFLASCIL